MTCTLTGAFQELMHSSEHIQLVAKQQQLYRAACKPPQCCAARFAVRNVLDFSSSSGFSECF
jgi:hypothetical protein